MDYSDFKDVKFEKYCPKCEEYDTEDWVDPCSECICNGCREGTEVPLHYKGPKLIDENPGTKAKLGLKG